MTASTTQSRSSGKASRFSWRRFWRRREASDPAASEAKATASRRHHRWTIGIVAVLSLLAGFSTMYLFYPPLSGERKDSAAPEATAEAPAAAGTGLSTVASRSAAHSVGEGTDRSGSGGAGEPHLLPAPGGPFSAALGSGVPSPGLPLPPASGSGVAAPGAVEAGTVLPPPPLSIPPVIPAGGVPAAPEEAKSGSPAVPPPPAPLLPPPPAGSTAAAEKVDIPAVAPPPPAPLGPPPAGDTPPVPPALPAPVATSGKSSATSAPPPPASSPVPPPVHLTVPPVPVAPSDPGVTPSAGLTPPPSSGTPHPASAQLTPADRSSRLTVPQPTEPAGTGPTPPPVTGPVIPPATGLTPPPAPATGLTPPPAPATGLTPPSANLSAHPPTATGTKPTPEAFPTASGASNAGRPEAASATVPERPPVTSYDVDIYEPRPGDSWESISQEFYQDPRYAAALRAYNRNKPLQGGGAIDIPPLHILRRFGFDTSRSLPTSPAPGRGLSGSVIQPAEGRARPNDPWNAAPPTYQAGSPPPQAGGFKIYRVPTEGLSLPTIARHLLGNEQRWIEIYDLNPDVNASRVPAGTELRLPADARLPGN